MGIHRRLTNWPSAENKRLVWSILNWTSVSHPLCPRLKDHYRRGAETLSEPERRTTAGKPCPLDTPGQLSIWTHSDWRHSEAPEKDQISSWKRELHRVPPLADKDMLAGRWNVTLECWFPEGKEMTAAKSISCCFRGLGFDSQHPRDSL